MKFEDIEEGVYYEYLSADGWRIGRAEKLVDGRWEFSVYGSDWGFFVHKDGLTINKLNQLVIIDDLVKM